MAFPIIGPQFLIDNINTIALVMAVMTLVIFDEFVSRRIIFPTADFVKNVIFSKLLEISGTKKYSKITKHISEFLATTIFLFYCYLGYAMLGVYIIEPILIKLQNIILIIVIMAFVLVSYVFNNRKLRKKYLIG